jgi:hypothetical protein
MMLVLAQNQVIANFSILPIAKSSSFSDELQKFKQTKQLVKH